MKEAMWKVGSHTRFWWESEGPWKWAKVLDQRAKARSVPLERS